MSVTVEFENDLTANHSDEALLFLMTITSEELNEEIYCVNNNEAVVSRGRTFEAFPFEIRLPPEDGGTPKDLKLVTYNLSDEFMDLVRQAQSPPEVKLELVSTRDLDEVEKTIDFMSVGGATYDALTITFTLIANNFSARKTLQATYNQAEFPGLFFALQ